ncbi:cyclic nucleotide-binding domain-containing protein [Desulfococcaceae bacterium HSG8]|nr:cyclic nucleotide-binding domain-containing protein [Desulfococcaceae bacterium HSG8]
MKIKCEKCHTGYSLDASLIKEKGTKFRCAKCEHVFKVYPPKDVVAEKKPGSDPEQEKPSSEKSPKFKIIGENNCPLYDQGDEFRLSGNAFFGPPNKAPCLILVKDVMKLLKKDVLSEGDTDRVFNCSGCTGLIRFSYKEEKEISSKPARPEDYIGVVARSLSKFSIFQSLDENIVKEFTSYLKFDEFAMGDTIIRKGDPGRNLYIVVSGRVEVVGDDDMSLAFMGKGEVFGEMSLLSGNPVGATIKVIKPSTVLYIGAKDFRKVLNKSSSLQMYFTRLLAGRMAEINTARSEEFASGMAGKLSEMPPSELFQTFNMNQKTGVLTLKLADTTAYLSFREGGLVSVKYDGKEGDEAFFELLKLKRGRFKFIPGLSPEEMKASEVGDFMHLLMEGLRRIDEDDRRFIRTVIPILTE